MVDPLHNRWRGWAAAAVLLAVAAGPAAFPAALAAPASEAPLELIIAPDAFQETLLPLKAWREAQGLRTDIVTISHLIAYQSSVGARDLADAIHRFVAARKASDARFEFLLLVGDDPVVPSRALQVANRTAGAALSNDQRSMVSDYFYAVTAADFLNASDYGDEYPGGDVWYGISDDTWSLSPDLHVGRIPVNTQAELSGYLGRLLSWEASPPGGSWAERAVFGLPVATPPAGWAPDDRPVADAAVAFAPAAAAASARGLTPVALSDYPGWPAPFSPSADNLSEAQVLAEWSGGASVIVVGGRDNPLAGGPGTEYAGDGASSVFLPVARPLALDSLSNGAKLPVAVAAFGYSANFSLPGDASIERALLSANGGAAHAVGFTGPTSLGAGPGSPRGGWTLASLVVEELLSSGTTVGEAVDAARGRLVAEARASLGPAFDPNDPQLRSTLAGLTLLGDPASAAWSGPPRSLTIAGPETVAPNTRTNVSFSVEAGAAPVENATVAVLDEVGDLRGWGRTDARGKAAFELVTGAADAVWTATATAAGYLRASTTIAIDTPPVVVIVSPGDGERVGGNYTAAGVAGDPDAGDAVASVQVSVDGGPWLAAAGSDAWSYGLGTLAMTNGPHTLRARAYDGKAWGPPAQVTFNVTNPVPPTVLRAYDPFVVPEDGNGSFDLDLMAHFAPTGPGGDFDVSLGEAEFVRVTVNGSRVEVVPAPQFFGSTTVPMTVTDPYGGNLTVNLTIVVVAADDPPVLSVRSNTSVREGGVITFDPRAFDPDGTTPEVWLESGPPNATVTGWQAPRRSAGTYVFVFAATDGQSIARVTVTVTVLVHNGPPHAALGAPERGEAGRELAFEALGLVDPDGDEVVVEWTFGDGQRATGPTTTHVYALPGDYTVTLTLTDGRESVVRQSTVHIDPYTPPGAPPTAALAAIAYGSIAVIAGSLGFAGYRAWRARGGGGGGADRDVRRDAEEE